MNALWMSLIVFWALLIVPPMSPQDSSVAPRNQSPNSLEQRHRRQVEIARQSADKGDPWAQTLLGIHYQAGIGVNMDKKEAMKWFSMAAQQDFADAQYHLGRMHEDGEGVPQDFSAAAEWYRKAANHPSLLDGALAARRRLARMYMLGRGVLQDYVEADVLFRISGADSMVHRIHAADASKLLQVESKMTAGQIDEAKHRADTWIVQNSGR
jgi:uncharacterized protein